MLSNKIKKNGSSFTRFFNVVAQSYLYHFFLYFIIVRKSIRTVKQENHGINGNKETSFGSSKKRDLLI
jgi:hypothetical protein